MGGQKEQTMAFPNIAEIPSGGPTWWGGTPSPMLRDEVTALAREEGCSVRGMMYALLREALAVRRKAAPSESTDDRLRQHYDSTRDLRQGQGQRGEARMLG
jgi:hypothetical protein